MSDLKEILKEKERLIEHREKYSIAKDYLHFTYKPNYDTPHHTSTRNTKKVKKDKKPIKKRCCVVL